MSRREAPRAFTIIETLVVVAILSVLIAIATPVFRGARESARDIKCRANQRTLAQAVAGYLVDDDTLPFAAGVTIVSFTGGGPPAIPNPFEGFLEDVPTRERSVWVCPGDRAFHHAGGALTTAPLSSFYFAGLHMGSRPAEARRITNCYLQWPRYPILGEGSDQPAVAEHVFGLYRHRGRANQAWIDGSVGAREKPRLWQPAMPLNGMPF